MAFSVLMILGVGVIAVWDGFRSSFTFPQFFLRFALIFTIYKAYDMVCFDYFLLMKFKFFQYYYPEVEAGLFVSGKDRQISWASQPDSGSDRYGRAADSHYFHDRSSGVLQ